MPSGGGLNLFFNTNRLPCGAPPAPPPPEIGPSVPPTIALGTTASIGVGISPLTIDAPPDLAAGDILLAFIHIGSPGGTDPIDLPGDAGAPAVVPPTGWTLVRTDRATGGAHGDMRGFLYSHVWASEPGTYSWSWDTSALSSVFLFGQDRYALGAIAGGIRSSAGIDTTSVGTAGSGPLVIDALTPAQSGELLVGFAGNNSGSGSTVFVPSGWTQDIAPTYIQQSIGAFDKFAAGAGVSIGTTPVTIGSGPGETSIGYVIAMLRSY